MNKLHPLLEAYGLRKTKCRMKVLQLFLDHRHALAHAAIEQQLGSQFDRVTLYRTLHSFEEHGLLHSIPSTDGITRYALCQQACNKHRHQHDHIHFSCTTCGHTYCLNEVYVPTLRLPEGYQIKEFRFCVQGVCNKCVLQPVEYLAHA